MITASSVPNWMTADAAAPGSRPTQKCRNDLEMRRRTDRDEFGKPLDEAEHECLNDRHYISQITGRIIGRRPIFFRK